MRCSYKKGILPQQGIGLRYFIFIFYENEIRKILKNRFMCLGLLNLIRDKSKQITELLLRAIQSWDVF